MSLNAIISECDSVERHKTLQMNMFNQINDKHFNVEINFVRNKKPTATAIYTRYPPNTHTD